jgi:chromosome segregation ATPase
VICSNEALQEQITEVDKKLNTSIKDRKDGMANLEVKVDKVNKDLCGVKDDVGGLTRDVAEVKKVLDKKVITALHDHNQMLGKNNEELAKLKTIVDLAPAIEAIAKNADKIEEIVANKIAIQRLQKWAFGGFGFLALVTAIAYYLFAIFTHKAI